MRSPVIIHQPVIILLAAVFFISCPYSSLEASEFSAAYFEPTYQDEGISMQLQGTGLKSVFFIKAFVAALYSSDGKVMDAAMSKPKHLEVQYFVRIPARKLNMYTVERMKLNTSRQEFLSLENEIDEMSQYFVDLSPGDRFSLTYIPALGTKFAYNGNITGIIQGEDFARALFSVWIGERPFDNSLKNQILGLSNTGKSNAHQLVMRINN